jgi:hypothetical protein
MKPLALSLVGFALSACVSVEPVAQTAQKKVAVAHLAWMQVSVGPWWQPPGDEAELKQFDSDLDDLINQGDTGHHNGN